MLWSWRRPDDASRMWSGVVAGRVWHGKSRCAKKSTGETTRAVIKCKRAAMRRPQVPRKMAPAARRQSCSKSRLLYNLLSHQFFVLKISSRWAKFEPSLMKAAFAETEIDAQSRGRERGDGHLDLRSSHSVSLLCTYPSPHTCRSPSAPLPSAMGHTRGHITNAV